MSFLSCPPSLHPNQDVAHYYVDQESVDSSQTSLVLYCQLVCVHTAVLSIVALDYYLWQRKGAASEYTCSFNRLQEQIFARGFFFHTHTRKLTIQPNKNADQQSTGVVVASSSFFAKDKKTAKQLLHLQMAIGVIFHTTKSRLCLAIGFDEEVAQQYLPTHYCANILPILNCERDGNAFVLNSMNFFSP